MTNFIKRCTIISVIEVIKEKLRRYGLTLTAFSKELNISRPTLDSYIRLYESGAELPNKKFSALFDALFSSEYLSESEFYERLQSGTYLLHRDSLLGITGLDIESTDTLSNIIDIAKRDMFRDNYDTRLYTFITLLLNNYYRNSVLRHIVSYFLTLTGIIDAAEVTAEEELAFSNYYPVFKSEVNNTMQLNQSSLIQFYKRVSEINHSNDNEIENLSQQLMNTISEKIQQRMNQGYKVEDINIQKLLLDLHT